MRNRPGPVCAKLRQLDKASAREAIAALKIAIAELRDEMGDRELAERLIGEALVHVGEARGYRNFAADIGESR